MPMLRYSRLITTKAIVIAIIIKIIIIIILLLLLSILILMVMLILIILLVEPKNTVNTKMIKLMPWCQIN